MGITVHSSLHLSLSCAGRRSAQARLQSPVYILLRFLLLVIAYDGMMAFSSFAGAPRVPPPAAAAKSLLTVDMDDEYATDNMLLDLVYKILLFVYLVCNKVEVIENKVFRACCPPTKRDLAATGDDEKVLMLDGGAGRNIAGADRFILDSGASVHATGNRALLSGYTRIPTGAGHVIRVANGDPLPIRGFGALNFEGFTLNRVLHVQGLAKNIISVSKLAELNYSVDFTGTGCFVRDAGTGDLVGQGRLVAGLFELDFLEVPLGRAPPPPPPPPVA